ncbi:MAG TPA: hypothetical protein VEF76_06950 [Patescibacteria group bacterium]|nr:hypothetical protein [Patescibacteria group bacterium]
MKKIALALAVALCLSTVADAKTSTAGPRGSCYTQKEFEAEQGLRIHSELMVIGLTCLKMPQGAQGYLKYQSFTQKNKGLISGYEDDLIGYYRRTSSGNPEIKLHTLRTTLANQISQHAIQMSTVSFCKRFSPRIDQALSMDKGKIRKWAQHSWQSSPTSAPVCTN